MNVILFLLIRASHVLLAAMWLGSTVLLSFYLMPAVADSGPAGGQVMVALDRRGIGKFIPSIAGITILSGFWLFWRFTGGFDPGVSRSSSGLAFGIGGIAGLIAGIIGGGVVGRGANQLFEIAERLPGVAEGPERAALMQRMGALRARVASAGKIVIALQVVALVLMSIGHYI